MCLINSGLLTKAYVIVRDAPGPDPKFEVFVGF